MMGLAGVVAPALGSLQSREGAENPKGARTLRSGTVPALTSWHQCRAARAPGILLNEDCCCVPGPDMFVCLGKEAYNHRIIESESLWLEETFKVIWSSR